MHNIIVSWILLFGFSIFFLPELTTTVLKTTELWPTENAGKAWKQAFSQLYNFPNDHSGYLHKIATCKN